MIYYKYKCSMYSRILFVLDFVRRFFVRCAKIFEAYAVRTLMKFGCKWRKIGRKGKCRKDSESTFNLQDLSFNAHSYVYAISIIYTSIRLSDYIRNSSCKARCLSTLF